MNLLTSTDLSPITLWKLPKQKITFSVMDYASYVIRSNKIEVKEWKAEHREFPYLYPDPVVDFYFSDKFKATLPQDLMAPFHKVCKEIVHNWDGFPQGFLASSAIIRLDTTLPVPASLPLASPLSLISAILTSTIKTMDRVPILSFFCATRCIRNKVRASPLQLVLGLIGQLEQNVSWYRNSVNLADRVCKSMSSFCGADPSLSDG